LPAGIIGIHLFDNTRLVLVSLSGYNGRLDLI